VPIVDLDQAHVAFAAREGPGPIDVDDLVGAAVDDQHRNADVREADVEALELLHEPEVDARLLFRGVIVDGEEAVATPGLPRRRGSSR
jgi:hypothetical protein